jgi:hypothetical protein
LRKRSFGYLTEDRRLANPVNIFIEPNGTKYIADPTAGAVFVFDSANALQGILGKDLRISPIDVAVRGDHCYVTDFASNQIVVMDKTTGKEIRRLGEAGDGDKQFKLISDLTFGPEGDLFATDKLKAKIFHFDPSGEFKRTIGQRGDNIDELVRPKGIAVDREDRIWVICAGVSIGASVWSTEVAKIYDQTGRLLLLFGRPGHEPGNMNMPAKSHPGLPITWLFRRTPSRGQNRVPGVRVKPVRPEQSRVYGFGDFRLPAGQGGGWTPRQRKPAAGADPSHRAAHAGARQAAHGRCPAAAAQPRDRGRSQPEHGAYARAISGGGPAS